MKSLVCCGLLLGLGASSFAEEVILLNYYERAPYAVRLANGEVTGLTADPAAAAFQRAGIRFQWQSIPAKRQLVQIERGNTLECGVGWYKTTERAGAGKFTDAIYRDKPTVAVARVNFHPTERTLAALAANPSVRILAKSGLTYGRDVPGIMATAKAKLQVITGDQSALARMVAADRADFVLSPNEEAMLLIANVETGAHRLKIMTFDDVVAGDTRHIWCSKKVSDDTIAKLNVAIEQTAKSGK
jgi:ethanolamine utilization microcompartment shell protein EutS